MKSNKGTLIFLWIMIILLFGMISVQSFLFFTDPAKKNIEGDESNELVQSERQSQEDEITEDTVELEDIVTEQDTDISPNMAENSELETEDVIYIEEEPADSSGDILTISGEEGQMAEVGKMLSMMSLDQLLMSSPGEKDFSFEEYDYYYMPSDGGGNIYAAFDAFQTDNSISMCKGMQVEASDLFEVGKVSASSLRATYGSNLLEDKIDDEYVFTTVVEGVTLKFYSNEKNAQDIKNAYIFFE
ncbi:MAG TPA: hypothetical protein VJZ04_07845 [Lachnospiraceae bacterium]|nr:hypothetical protein [Lachnospiraceae bacterium]